MYIEELIIEGFKSYATRTVIRDWDEKFNAITGLNGSGKSNIFDAIIFVLGAVNWSQLRAQSINNLVYKDGQTGVKKASVTIVFNNEDKSASPIGYEKFDQITVTRQIAIEGRSKYLINGHMAQLDRVSNLFRSVRLNMKNPHFLIMQGHISKVLNMKGLEILGMIEEAAGTKLYEDKRLNALKTIEKKDKKVEEINQILDEKINPTLSKLREQQKQYVTWLENKRDFERLEKFRIAYQYTEYSKQQKGSETELREYEQKIISIEAELARNQEELKQKKSEIAKLTERKEKRMTSEVHDLEQQVDVLSKDLVQRKAVYQNLEQTHEAEAAKLEELRQSESALVAQIEKQKKAFEAYQTKYTEAEKAKLQKKEQLDNLKRQLQAVSVGVAADGEGTAKTLADQLMDRKRDVLKFDTDAKSCATRVTHAEKELKKSQAQLKKEDGDYKGLKQNEDALLKDLEKLKKTLPKNFSQEHFDNLVAQKKELAAKIKENENTIHNKQMRLQSADFQYKSPSNKFDRSKVHGRVANLLRIEDRNFATALEVAAGGKLYNVVVDSEETGSLLLQHSNLKQRTTFIPLNKIRPNVLNDTQVQTANKVAGKKVATALSLVEYEDADRAAMEYVFGSTLVCQESDDAKKVTFHKSINARSVTREGDLFDPAGTLSGGSRPEGDSLLQQLNEVQNLTRELEKLKTRLSEVEAELSELSDHMATFAKVKDQLDLKTREIDLLTQRIQRTSYFQLQKQVEDLTQQLASEKANSEEYLVKKQEAEKLVVDIEQQIKNFNKEDQLTKTKKNITKAKTELEELTEKLKGMQHEQVKLQSELEQSQEELGEVKTQRALLEADLKKSELDLQKKKESLDKREKEYLAQKSLLDGKKDDCLKADTSIAKLISERDGIIKAISDGEINLKKYNHKIISFHQTREKATKIVADLKKQHSWIEKEEQFFGRGHGEYDFAMKSIAEVILQLRKLEEEQEYLSKRVNKKAFNMVEQAQQEYDQLIEKKTQIEGDKEKIVHFISELDEKKNKELLETYKKVDKDFGSIFSTLLPGAMAKLEPDKGKSVLEGVNIRVALGKTWKENLSELSGGQRSLLALSLVLALLLVNPAPMYILDEIDAALDLSHTQNIGEMLKTHFTQSQFIIISLKEGMFNNANVLFKVKNVNGSSQVTRIDNRSAKQKQVQEKEKAQEGELKRKRT